jgi:C-1 hydroxylase
MTYDETVRFLQTREEKFNRHDVNALAADHTDDGVVRSPIFPIVQGVVNIQSSYRALFTMFPDMRIAFEQPIIDGDRAAHPFTARATHVGEFMGMPGSGRKFQIVGTLLYRFDDGLIAEERRIYDFTALLMQVGVLKGRPAG